MASNDLGLRGIEFIEFSSPNPESLAKLFTEFGFSKLHDHKDIKVSSYHQGDIQLLLNQEGSSFASSFHNTHGPSAVSMGWKVVDPDKALKLAVERGAKKAEGDYKKSTGEPIPAIYGIGDSIIYFVADAEHQTILKEIGFQPSANPTKVASKGFTFIDHLTNNVEKGTMEHWSNFYKDIFGFEEVRYFDIRGVKTGLTSYALRSPCGSFCIPINEGTEEGSQINEYLREYKGPGVQHIAFATEDIVHSVSSLSKTSVETLDIDEQYYQEVFDRVPRVTEDHKTLEKLNILVDGDEEGYLLQIFTKNLIGPIFIEIIQRKNHLSFGEGNFGALFRSIERDQEKRGVL
ncbi:MAG: 4-hydroxyphenylpyruvate dioxygenase [Oligoflexales bacterium]|nr:4-hydroxyphenylpyruvate dioxygenase [Oligoflexales bacterium]